MEENQSVQSRWDQACSLLDEGKDVEAFELFHQLADEGTQMKAMLKLCI